MQHIKHDHTFKGLTKLILILLVTLLIFSCSAKPKDPTEPFWGQWEYYDNKNGYDAFQYDIEFLEDGTFLIPETPMLLVNTFEYSIMEGDRLRLTAMGNSEIIEFELEGDILKLIFTEGYNLYVRAGTQPISAQTNDNILSNEPTFSVPSEPGIIDEIVSDISNRHPVITLKNADEVVELRHFDIGNENKLRDIALAPNGSYLAVKRLNENIIFVDIASGKLLGELKESGPAVSLSFSHSGNLFAYSDGNNFLLKVIDLDSHTVIQNINTPAIADCVSFSPDGKLLAAISSDKTIRLWEVSSGNNLLSLEQPCSINEISFSVDGKTLVGGCSQAPIYSWSVESGQISRQTGEYYFTQNIHRIIFHPDGKTLILGAQLVDLENWNVFGSISDGSVVVDVAVSKNGDLLSQNNLNHITLTDYHQYGYEIERFVLPDSVNLDGLITINGVTSTFEEFRQGFLLDDGTRLTWYGNKRTRTIIHERPPKILGTLNLDDASSNLAFLDFSRDGKFLVSYEYDGIIRVWGIP